MKSDKVREEIANIVNGYTFSVHQDKNVRLRDKLFDQILALIKPEPKQFPISACCNASVKYYDSDNGAPYYRCEACGFVCQLADAYYGKSIEKKEPVCNKLNRGEE